MQIILLNQQLTLPLLNQSNLMQNFIKPSNVGSSHQQSTISINSLPSEQNRYETQHLYQEQYCYPIQEEYLQYSPTFNYSEKEEEQELDYQKSQTLVIRKEKENIVSGIHEKYLRSDNFVSKKRCSRSETKSFTSKPLVAKLQKKDNLLMSQIQNLNPLTEGLNALQIQSQKLKDEVRLHKTLGEDERAYIFSQLGFKQPKNLGKARTVRQFQNLVTFLQCGDLPTEYVSDFLLLLQN